LLCSPARQHHCHWPCHHWCCGFHALACGLILPGLRDAIAAPWPCLPWLHPCAASQLGHSYALLWALVGVPRCQVIHADSSLLRHRKAHPPLASTMLLCHAMSNFAKQHPPQPCRRCAAEPLP
jgi:hypothetical protein